MSLKDDIKDWEFIGNPTEEAEPFYWKWTEEGLSTLTGHIQLLIRGNIDSLKKPEWTGGSKKNVTNVKYNQALDDLWESLTK